jgi:hypothetical protein
MVERSDEYIVGRLISQVRLLIATNDEMPTERKLQSQPMLKDLEHSLSVPAAEQDRARVRSQYAFLCRELEDEADCMALLEAMQNFVPYLRA